MNISNDLKKFIEENIELIENYDLGALYVKATHLCEVDKVSLYKILKDVADSHIWLQNTSAIPYGFFDNEQIDTIIVPPNIEIIGIYAIDNCGINKIVCEGGTDIALKISGVSFTRTRIKTFIAKRDIHLKSGVYMMSYMDEFETNNNIIIKGESPFGFLYDVNEDIHFIVSKDSMLIYSNGKSPESLAKHLINIGFKNVAVV